MKVKITKDNNCLYLTQNISDLNLYQRAKAIRNFINNETKVLEDLVEVEIRAIFSRNGVEIQDTDKLSLEMAFECLKYLGKQIVVKDIYENVDLYHCVVVGKSKNKMNVVLEDNEILQVGIMVEEREIQ